MDVINMSLGGNAHGNQDLLTVAVDNLDRAGIVVAVSAGNDGPGHYTVGSPGSAERALTAGASSVGHFISVPVTSGTSRFETAAGDFTTPATPLTGTLVAAKPTAAGDLGLGCTAGSYPASVAGNIALVSRGDCTFGNKVAVAEAQKAAAVIVVNNVAGDPTAMAADEAFPTKLPAVMAGLADKAALTGIATAAGAATIGTDKRYVQTRNSDIMAGFSSQGPTDVDFRVKPDLVAPGVNVLSSIPGSFCDAGTQPRRLLGVLLRHVDGQPAPRRYGGRRPAGPPALGRVAGPLGDHQHRHSRACWTTTRCWTGPRPTRWSSGPGSTTSTRRSPPRSRSPR